MAEAKKILIVEDEPDMVEWLTVFFQDHGYDAIAAYDGIQGLEMVQSEKPDLITLDITMEKETGLKMYRKLLDDEALSHIPVVIITGISQDLSRFLGRKKGMRAPDGFFEKPVDKEGLIQKVKELIG
jgi:DNA-binding response OmpR family regulator